MAEPDRRASVCTASETSLCTQISSTAHTDPRERAARAANGVALRRCAAEGTAKAWVCTHSARSRRCARRGARCEHAGRAAAALMRGHARSNKVTCIPQRRTTPQMDPPSSISSTAHNRTARAGRACGQGMGLYTQRAQPSLHAKRGTVRARKQSGRRARARTRVIEQGYMHPTTPQRGFISAPVAGWIPQVRSRAPHTTEPRERAARAANGVALRRSAAEGTTKAWVCTHSARSRRCARRASAARRVCAGAAASPPGLRA